MRERHLAAVGKKHSQELSAMHKSYSTELNHLNKSVQENKATVDKLVLKNISLRHKHKEELDALKLAHKESIRVLQQFHAKQVNKNSRQLKAAQELVAGMEILHKELVDEWSHARRDAKGLTKKASELQLRADKATYNLKWNKERVDGLTDELLDAKERIADLDCKLLEYEDVIDALNHQFEQQEEEYNDMLSFMEQCCMDEVKRVAPKFIAKHYVLNKDGKGI